MTKKLLIAIFAIMLAFISCKTRLAPDIVMGKEDPSSKRTVETFAQGLEVPWAIVFTPDKRMLVSERPGRIRVIENGVLKKEPLAVLSDVASEQEAGLLGLALHPNFSSNHWLYLCYTTKDNGEFKERVKRFKEDPKGLSEEKIIIDNIPASPIHAGCRLIFGPDGKLYITTGDAGKKELAQKLDSLAGKTLRLNDDGSIPSDNPFVAQAGARHEIWSYGHRNAQGIAFQPGSNLMFQTEHGPSGFDAPGGGDEINIVERGKNYGWPIIHHQMTKAGLESPILEYTPAIAPAGAIFYQGDAIPEWHNDFFFANLRGRRIVRVRFDNRKVVESEVLFKDAYGRIRDIAQGPDGALYFTTSNRDGRGEPAANDDRIMRIR